LQNLAIFLCSLIVMLCIVGLMNYNKLR
jgi:hypothetical protein